MRPPRSVPIRIALNIVLGYVLLVLLLSGCQRKFIYYPATAAEPTLLGMAENYGFEPVRAAEKIVGWLRSAQTDNDPSEALVMVFHGNAGFALHRSYYADVFDSFSAGSWDTFVLEYPGYGARKGRPSEAALITAAEEAFLLLTAEHDGPVYLLGESLGSGVATALARRHPETVSGLILITPFDSLISVAAHHFPYLPVRWVLRDRFDNQSNLTHYAGPVAILLAEKDAVVPARFGRALYESYTNGPKLLHVQPGRDHNTLDLSPQHPFWADALSLLQK